MDNEKPIDYQVVLADLKSRRDQLDQAILAIEAMQGIRSEGAPVAKASSNGGGPAELRRDSFFGMTVLEASKKYLAMVKRPTAGADIAAALKEGGYLFTASKPGDTVTAILNRDDAKNGDVVRIGKAMFGLAEWYPNRPKRKKVSEAAVPAPDAEKPAA